MALIDHQYLAKDRQTDIFTTQIVFIAGAKALCEK
jgi:hypothetical protein